MKSITRWFNGLSFGRFLTLILIGPLLVDAVMRPQGTPALIFLATCGITTGVIALNYRSLDRRWWSGIGSHWLEAEHRSSSDHDLGFVMRCLIGLALAGACAELLIGNARSGGPAICLVLAGYAWDRRRALRVRIAATAHQAMSQHDCINCEIVLTAPSGWRHGGEAAQSLSVDRDAGHRPVSAFLAERGVRLSEHRKCYRDSTKATESDPAPHDCPVCGQTRSSKGGSYEICTMCRWEDDPTQLANPDFAGGANRESLNRARALWQARTPNE